MYTHGQLPELWPELRVYSDVSRIVKASFSGWWDPRSSYLKALQCFSTTCDMPIPKCAGNDRRWSPCIIWLWATFQISDCSSHSLLKKILHSRHIRAHLAAQVTIPATGRVCTFFPFELLIRVTGRVDVHCVIHSWYDLRFHALLLLKWQLSWYHNPFVSSGGNCVFPVFTSNKLITSASLGFLAIRTDNFVWNRIAEKFLHRIHLPVRKIGNVKIWSSESFQ